MVLYDIIHINFIKNSQIIFVYIRKLCGIKDDRLNSFHFTAGIEKNYLEIYNKIGTRLQVNCLWDDIVSIISYYLYVEKLDQNVIAA